MTIRTAITTKAANQEDEEAPSYIGDLMVRTLHLYDTVSHERAIGTFIEGMRHHPHTEVRLYAYTSALEDTFNEFTLKQLVNGKRRQAFIAILTEVHQRFATFA